MVVSVEALAKAIRANSLAGILEFELCTRRGARTALGSRQRVAENVEAASQWLTRARRRLFCYLAFSIYLSIRQQNTTNQDSAAEINRRRRAGFLLDRYRGVSSQALCYSPSIASTLIATTAAWHVRTQISILILILIRNRGKEESNAVSSIQLLLLQQQPPQQLHSSSRLPITLLSFFHLGAQSSRFASPLFPLPSSNRTKPNFRPLAGYLLEGD